MNADARWERVKELFHAALDQPPAARDAYLSAACAGDGEMEREVQSLLVAYDAAGGFLEEPAFRFDDVSPSSRSATFQVGDRLGRYEVTGLLGEGGMGEVYRGRDALLGREVALKVISPTMAEDPSQRHRFEREARAASALNHPAIVTVYDVGQTRDIAWIAMEFVDGCTLRQALGAGPLSVAESRAIARQIAEGLAVAHDRGIIHRDLKPENVMVGEDGRVKILDFGLARESPAATIAQAAEDGPPAAITVDGLLLGTVGYMSPEQASGRVADFRADQFALGAVVYEMLTGQRAFARPTGAETLSAIISQDPPPLRSLRPEVPDGLRQVVERCLAKSPGDRYSSTRELLSAFDVVDTSASRTPGNIPLGREFPAPTQPAWAFCVHGLARLGRRAAATLAVLFLFVVMAVAWLMMNRDGTVIDSLAVLPFEVEGAVGDARYLGDELAESLIDQMSRVPSLKVMARGTTFRLRGAADPIAAVRSLGVGALLTGTLARRGTQLVISAELIDVRSGTRLWGDSYNRPFADLLLVQDDIASQIVDGLRLQLSGHLRERLSEHGTTDAGVYQLVLKGRYLLREDSAEGDAEARRLFEEAARRDPGFVDAHLGVASTYLRSASGGDAPPAEMWPRADESLRKVLSMDPGNVRARAALASLRYQRDWDWAGAEREFLALRDDPELFLGNQVHAAAMFFWARGRPEESVTVMERALRTDPGNLESRIMLADFLAKAGRLDDAMRRYREIVAIAPGDSRPLFGLAEVLRRGGELAPAIETLRRAYEASGEELGARDIASARNEQDYDAVEVAVARAQLEHLQEIARERYVSPLDLARLFARTGAREQAFAALERAFAERSPMLVLLRVDEAWDTIRGDPRFAVCVGRVGIP